MTQIGTIFGVVVTPTVILVALNICADMVTYFLYNWKLFQGKTDPNKTTWFLWSFTSTLNAASYLVVTGDRVKAAHSVENAVMCTLTFCFVFWRGTRQPLQKNDKRVLAIGTLAGLVWWFFREAFYASAIMQVANVVSIFPLYRSLKENPKSESALPWLMWCAIYTTTLIVVLLRWNGHWYDPVYPFINVCLHVVVLLLIIRPVRNQALHVSAAS